MLPWSLLILGVHVFELDPVKQEATVQPDGLLADGTRKRKPRGRLSDGEIDVWRAAVMPRDVRW